MRYGVRWQLIEVVGCLPSLVRTKVDRISLRMHRRDDCHTAMAGLALPIDRRLRMEPAGFLCSVAKARRWVDGFGNRLDELCTRTTFEEKVCEVHAVVTSVDAGPSLH